MVTPDNEELVCRSYYLLVRGKEDRRPSPQYLDIIIRGAIQNNLPVDYVASLKAIVHNGYDGDVQIKVPT